MAKSLILLPSLFLLLSPLAQAELMVGESLEWAVADSDLIVSGRILARPPAATKTNTQYSKSSVSSHLRGVFNGPRTPRRRGEHGEVHKTSL